MHPQWQTLERAGVVCAGVLMLQRMQLPYVVPAIHSNTGIHDGVYA